MKGEGERGSLTREIRLLMQRNLYIRGRRGLGKEKGLEHSAYKKTKKDKGKGEKGRKPGRKKQMRRKPDM